jgi:acyl-[acyl-carrier-protein]-phospholipid O-acyltransferase/long-chain-fatty-acid--[acyl-carrier-protein] ligase
MGMLWGSIFSYYYGKIRLRMPKELPHPASVTVGKALPKNITPFKIRQVLSELAAETEMEPRDEERPLHYRFAKRAKFHPFKKTIKDFEGTEISNFSLFVRAAILSREIKKMVPKEDKYVGVMLPNVSVAAITILGTMLADKVPAILNFTASKEMLAASIKKAELNCILTSRKFIKKANLEELPEMIFLEDVAKGVTKPQKIWMTLAFILLPHQEIMNYLAPKTHRDVFKTAVLLFSSGSTGEPKGVMLSHHNINSNVFSCLRIMGWSQTDKLVGNLPLFHSFGITTNFWIPLMVGAKIVYLPNPLDGAAVGKAIEENKLTILLATPTFLQTYMRKCTKEQFKSLRLVVTGAEKLRKDIAEKFKKMTGLAAVEGYGCTELSPIVAINVAFSIMQIGTSPGKPGCIGPPMPGICVKIGDPATWEELPPGEEGLLLVKGPNVMQGYLNDPEKTADAIRNSWYNTGDIAKIDLDGYITITGRFSRFSKIGGEMVPHEMVEKTIYEILQSDKRCVAVCGAPDKSKGEKLVVLHTCEMEIKPESLLEKLRQADLPNLWIPKASNFYEVFELPLLGSGKLDLAKVTELARELALNEQ